MPKQLLFFALRSLSLGVPDQALLIAVGVVGYYPNGHGGPETTKPKHYYHPQQLLFLQLFPTFTSWRVSWIRLFSWLFEWLDTTQMIMVIQKQRISNIIIIPNNFCYHKLVLKSLLGGVPDQAPLLAVGVAGHHQDGHGGSKTKNSNIIIIPNSFCYYKLVLKPLPGDLPDQALLLAVGVAGHHQGAHGHPGTMKFKQYHHPQQLVSLQLCPKITSWGCPWSSSTLGYWSGWTPPRWSWSSGNILKSLHWWSSTSLINGTLPNNQSPKAERAILV